MYIAVAQTNPTVGALEANAEAMLAVVEGLAAAPYPPDLVVFPAYALTGFPLDGLVLSMAFGAECLDVSRKLIREAQLPCLFGSALPVSSEWGRHLDGEVVYCQDGRGGTLGFADQSADTYDYASNSVKVMVDGVRVAVVLGEYPDFGEDFADCELVVVLQAKDYRGAGFMHQSSLHLTGLRLLAQEAQAWVALANLVGGQDDLVFDGGSMVISPEGAVQACAPAFEAAVIECNLTFARRAGRRPGFGRGMAPPPRRPDDWDPDRDFMAEVAAAVALDKVTPQPHLPFEANWQALALATRDYVTKNGFSDVLVGLSGGIDSSLVATLAVDALGAEHVHGLLMPSIHTSEASTRDALELAENLGISALVMPIEAPVAAVEAASEQAIGSKGSDLALQNLQARMRMAYLMHLSNTYGWLVLNTSNKSEAAMGFSTLYGDTAGAFSPFGNVYKTDLYELARWRNSRGRAIPEAVLSKPPSPELYPGHLATDSLPPYDVLDRILRLHIEDNMGVDQILDIVENTPEGDPIAVELVESVLARVAAAEFKRRQEPLAPKIGNVDMTMNRNWPMTNGFRDHSRGIGGTLDADDLLAMLRGGDRPEGWRFMDN